MNDKLLKQFAPRHALVPPPTEPDPGDVDDYVAFGCLRGVRDRALMLELRKKDGAVIAFGYAWLEKVEFDPSSGIILRFGREQVHLKGRNLNLEVRPNVRLLDAILRHKALYIQESGNAAALAAGKDALVIEQIKLE